MRANLDQSDVAMARIISNQLSNLLATRVACLTIILVVILPIFGIVTFPEDDFSMRTWVMRLSDIQLDLKQATGDGDYFGTCNKRFSQKKACVTHKTHVPAPFSPPFTCPSQP